jgi:hypothetical protein
MKRVLHSLLPMAFLVSCSVNINSAELPPFPSAPPGPVANNKQPPPFPQGPPPSSFNRSVAPPFPKSSPPAAQFGSPKKSQVSKPVPPPFPQAAPSLPPPFPGSGPSASGPSRAPQFENQQPKNYAQAPVSPSSSAQIVTVGEPPADVVMIEELEEISPGAGNSSWQDKKKWFSEAGMYVQKIDGIFDQAKKDFDEREGRHRSIDKTLDSFYRNASEAVGKATRIASDLKLYVDRKAQEYLDNGCVQARDILSSGSEPKAIPSIINSNIDADDVNGSDHGNVVFVDEQFGKTKASKICTQSQRKVVEKLKSLQEEVESFENSSQKLRASQGEIDKHEDALRDLLFVKMKDALGLISTSYGEAGRSRNDIPGSKSNDEAKGLFDKTMEMWRSAEKNFKEIESNLAKEFEKHEKSLKDLLSSEQSAVNNINNKSESFSSQIKEIGSLEEIFASEEEKKIASSIEKQVSTKQTSGNHVSGNQASGNSVPNSKPYSSQNSAQAAGPGRAGAAVAVAGNVASMVVIGFRDFSRKVLGLVAGSNSNVQEKTAPANNAVAVDVESKKEAFKESILNFGKAIGKVFVVGADYVKSSYKEFKNKKPAQEIGNKAPLSTENNNGGLNNVGVEQASLPIVDKKNAIPAPVAQAKTAPMFPVPNKQARPGQAPPLPDKNNVPPFPVKAKTGGLPPFPAPPRKN